MKTREDKLRAEICEMHQVCAKLRFPRKLPLTFKLSLVLSELTLQVVKSNSNLQQLIATNSYLLNFQKMSAKHILRTGNV